MIGLYTSLRHKNNRRFHSEVRCGQSQGGGGTLKLSVYIGEADFLGVKILNFRIFLGFQKK